MYCFDKRKLFYDLYKRIAYEVHFTYATDKKRIIKKINIVINYMFRIISDKSAEEWTMDEEIFVIRILSNYNFTVIQFQ